HGFAPQKQDLFYFPAVGERDVDPGNEFMKRFKGLLQIKKVSQSVRVAHGAVKDKATGKPGVIL
ncbi:MAG TPA: hypothetical protein VF719_11195, partial [Abditibacteriaceae bacterium]